MKYLKHATTGHIHAVPDDAQVAEGVYEAEEATKEAFDADIAAFKARLPEPVIGGPANFVAGAHSDGRVVVNVGSPLPDGFEPTDLPADLTSAPAKAARS